MTEQLPDHPREKIAECIVTPSVYLACALGTFGCTPSSKTKGPEKTRLGFPITKWLYENNGTAEEVFVLWGKRDDTLPAYADWTEREKRLVVAYMAAFCDNLHHFLAEVKSDE